MAVLDEQPGRTAQFDKKIKKCKMWHQVYLAKNCNFKRVISRRKRNGAQTKGMYFFVMHSCKCWLDIKLKQTDEYRDTYDKEYQP